MSSRTARYVFSHQNVDRRWSYRAAANPVLRDPSYHRADRLTPVRRGLFCLGQHEKPFNYSEIRRKLSAKLAKWLPVRDNSD